MKWTAGLLAIVALGFLALACNTETTLVQENEQSLGITVTGEGEAFGAPDIAVLTLGVEANAETVASARTQAADSMNAVIAALTAAGVAEEDIQTTRLSVQPRYNFSGQVQEIIGFTVSNIATVKVRDIDSTGDVIDGAIEAGGNNARLDSLVFTIDDPTELEDEARRSAMAEARARAETLAEAGGVELGRPRSIAEGGGPMPIPFAADAFRQEDAGGTPIELGELEVRIQVTVVYDLE
jgi:uncharacterized protein YggE